MITKMYQGNGEGPEAVRCWKCVFGGAIAAAVIYP